MEHGQYLHMKLKKLSCLDNKAHPPAPFCLKCNSTKCVAHKNRHFPRYEPLKVNSSGYAFEEYERLRNLGYSKEEALAKALGKGGYAIASTKVDDYLGKNNIR